MIFWRKKKSNEESFEKGKRQRCETLDGLKVVDFRFVPEDYNGIVLRCDEGYVNACALFKDGEMNGRFVAFNDFGKEVVSAYYTCGKLNDRRLEFFCDGNGRIIEKVDEYYKNGKREGPYVKTHYRNMTKEVGVYENGEKEDVWYYFERGIAFKKKTYKEGKLIKEEKVTREDSINS